jgi:hypothetical protein
MEWFWFAAIAMILCGGIMRNAGTTDARILRLALILTLAADFCFAFIDNPIYGMAAFCSVQMAYCLRYGGIRLCRLLSGLWAVLLTILLMLDMEPLYIAAALYAIAFICSLSAVFAVWRQYPQPNGRMILWGMLLFACCDICVGLNYLFPGSAYPLLWIFYLPGQALLSVSGIRKSNLCLLPFHKPQERKRVNPEIP